jgi:hypothetical protein
VDVISLGDKGVIFAIEMHLMERRKLDAALCAAIALLQQEGQSSNTYTHRYEEHLRFEDAELLVQI